MITKIETKIKRHTQRSLGKKLALMVSAVAWVGDSFVIVVVDVLVSDDSWELDLIQLFGWEETHFLQFTHSLHQFRVLVKSVSLLLYRQDETPGGGCLLLVVVKSAVQKTGSAGLLEWWLAQEWVIGSHHDVSWFPASARLSDWIIGENYVRWVVYGMSGFMKHP